MSSFILLRTYISSMSELYPTILFTVAIQQDPAWTLMVSREQHVALESHRTVWIPGFNAGKNLSKNNGDTILLHGIEAIYYKFLIDSGQLKDLIYQFVCPITPTPPVGFGTPINSVAINETALNGGIN